MGDWLTAAVDLIGNHPTLALWLVFLIAAAEALFVVGLFVPSTTVLVGAGTLVGMGRLDFAPIFAATCIGAIVGDAVSFWVGRTWKDRLRSIWPFTRFSGLIARTESYFARHGGKSVFIGRFVPGVKAMVPAVAGMSAMSPTRFAVINVLSAIAWSLAHLLPGVAVGRGIEVGRTGNPRALALIALVSIVMIAAWYAAKLASALALPRLNRLRLRIVDSLPDHARGWRRALRRLLTNERGTFVSFGMVAMALLMVAGFVLLLIALFVDPALSHSDAALGAWLQALRSDPLDDVMVALTMLGDGVVLLAIAVALVVSLLALRQWWIAASVAIAMLVARGFLTLLKLTVHRSRPVLPDGDAQSFSFPSGHATLSTTVIGISMLLLAHRLPPRWRRNAYAGTAAVIALIGFSRVYLLAHWPSDVIAGTLFGATLVFVMALILHSNTLALPAGRLAAVIGVTLFVGYAAHFTLHFERERTRYAQPLSTEQVTRVEWLDTGWAAIESRRVLLDGDFGEPITVQTDLALEPIVAALQAHGWHRRDDRWIDAFAGVVLPTRVALADRPVLPRTNAGHNPLAALTLDESNDLAAEDPSGRLVARIWRTTRVLEGGRTGDIVALSVTREKSVPIASGFTLTRSATLADAQALQIGSAIATVLPGKAQVHAGRDHPVWTVEADKVD